MTRSWIFISFLFVLITSCKVTQTTPQSGKKPADTIQVRTDTIPPEIPVKEYLITQKGDTLDSLGTEVDITISRYLPDTITIVGVGDIMMGTHFPNTSYLPSGNGEYLWKSASTYLQSADITFGNLEGTILDGEGEPKECKNPDACYLFKMPARLAANLVDNKFDLLSLANNHANDFGAAGRKSTQKILDSLGIAHAGAIEQPFTIQRFGHINVGLIAFSPNKGTLTFYDTNRACTLVKKMDSLADIVIVSIHGGAEGAKNMHVTRETEFYYGEDRGNIYEFSHQMIDAGADIIFGHGPHVVRAIEVYKNRLIAYSLGNFLTYGRFNLRGPNGEAPLLEVKTDATGKFLKGKIHPFLQSYSYGPVFDHKRTVIETMKKLTEEDFPENEIIIDEVGRIFYIQH